jgi:hypothetical protein
MAHKGNVTADTKKFHVVFLLFLRAPNFANR